MRIPPPVMWSAGVFQLHTQIAPIQTSEARGLTEFIPIAIITMDAENGRLLERMRDLLAKSWLRLPSQHPSQRIPSNLCKV